jgi:preprotein translocase SecE subunit
MNLIIKLIQFFKDAYNEFTKVAWLDKNEIVGITVITIVFVAVVSIFVSAVDFFLSVVVGTIL